MRRYGSWAGAPNGRAEQTDQCIAEVPVGGRSPLFKQCSRKRGHGFEGTLCKQHADKHAAGGHVNIPEG